MRFWGELKKSGNDLIVTNDDLMRSDSEGMNCDDSLTQVTVQNGDIILIDCIRHYISAESRLVVEAAVGNEVTLIRKE